MAAAQLFRSVCLLILTPSCYDQFFVEFDFFHGIVAGSILVKVPQILKIVRAGSGEGISIAGTILELFAIVFNVSYSFVNRYPFSSYGDGVFLLIQTTLIGALVLYYGGSVVKSTTFMITVLSAVTVLSSGMVPLKILWMLQATNIPTVFSGKMVQAIANYSNGSTGQLSAITVTMLFLGSMARIFTSIQETGDQIIILSYSAASLANGILMAQIIYYWNVTPKTKKE